MSNSKKSIGQELELDLCSLTGKCHSGDIFTKAWSGKARRDHEHYEYVFTQLPMFVGCSLADQTQQIVIKNPKNMSPYYHRSLLTEVFSGEIKSYVEVIKMLPDVYDYHEYTAVFRDCCQSMGLLDDDFYWSHFWGSEKLIYGDPESAQVVECFNQLVKNIREECRRTNARESLRERIRHMDKRIESCFPYVASIFSACSRVVVLRIDLGYRKDIAESVTLEQANRDIKRLVENKRCNKLFRGQLGYIFKTEFGVSKKLHFHTLLFFDGTKRDGRKHVHLAKVIGEYWKEVVTKGRGAYWNCNDRISDYIKLDRCGIGVIHRDDTKLRANLLNYVIRYMCKSEQFIRARFDRGYKLLRKGQPPRSARERRRGS